MARTRMAFVAACVVGTAWTCGAVDGTMWLGAPSSTAEMRYQDRQYWIDSQVAGEGGVASFSANSFCNIKFPSGLTLGGIDFMNGYQAAETSAFGGSDVTMSGDAFVRTSHTGTGIRLGVALKGSAGDTLTTKGAGRLRLLKNFSGFGRVRVADGTLEQTEAVSGRVFGDGTVGAFEIAGGIACYNPSASGTAVSLPGTLVAGRGAGVLQLNNGVTMTAAGLAFEPGGALLVTGGAGMSGIGATEKLFFTSPPVLVNGILDPRIVTRDLAVTGGPFSFLSYTAADGIAPYPESALVDLASAGSADVAVANPASMGADVAVDADRQVAALVVNERANLKIASGATLTVGDGVHPAGVIFREQTDANSTYSQFNFAGTLDFGTSHGVIWKGTPVVAAGRGLDVRGKIAGSAGVTFASRPMDGDKTTLYRFYDGCCGWTGPTYFHNARAWLLATNSLPLGGDVYICGGARGNAAGLFIEVGGTYSQNFHLAGVNATDGHSGLAGDTTGAITLSGTVTVDDALTVGAKGPLTFAGPLVGAGDISFGDRGQAVTYVLAGSTAGYSGKVAVTSSRATLAVEPSSALPTNTLTVSAGVVHLHDRTGVVVSTPLAGTANGTLRIDQSSLTLQGPRNFPGTLAVDVNSTPRECSSLGIAGAVRVGSLSGVNGGGRGVIAGASADAELAVGSSGKDFLVRPVLADGTGRLSFVKEGGGVAKIVSTNAYTGRTVVRGGTLRLRGSIFDSPSLSWWLDASRPETVLRDAGGGVTNWLSLVNGVSFVPVNNSARPTLSTLENGMGVVTFGADAHCGLATPTNVTQRTVFVVYRWAGAVSGVEFFCLFGRYGSDTGIRANASGYMERNISTSKFNTLGYVYQDGVKKTSNFMATTQGMSVLTLQKDIEYYKGESAAYATVPAAFRAEVGGYNNNDGRRWVGDIAEAIAFDRLLTDGERQAVENYLTEKWRGVAAHASVAHEETLSPLTDLTLEYGTVLDLAGADQTVASLSGCGTVMNSSTNPAALRVTGACDFAGELSGRTRLVAAGSGAKDFDVAVADEARLVLAGGSARIVAYTNTPPTAGLAYWLDASDESSVACDANGMVTNWLSKAGVIPAFSWASGMSGALSGGTGPKAYTSAADGINGLRTVHFRDGPTEQLLSRGGTSVRTLFLVAANDGNSSKGAGGYWGKAGIDRSIRCGSGATATFQPLGRVTYYFGQDTVRLNGEKRNMSGNVQPGKTPFCFMVRLDDAAHPEDEVHYGGSTQHIFGTPDALGAQTGNGNTNFRAAEVLAYTNALSDAEIQQVEAYLMNKWAIAGHAAEPGASSPFTGTGSLEIEGRVTLAGGLDLGESGTLVVHVDASGEVETVTVDGDLRIGAGVTLVVDGYDRAAPATRHTVVSVTGDAAGDFAGHNVTQPSWKLWRSGDSWYLVKASGTTVIFR